MTKQELGDGILLRAGQVSQDTKVLHATALWEADRQYPELLAELPYIPDACYLSTVNDIQTDSVRQLKYCTVKVHDVNMCTMVSYLYGADQFTRVRAGAAGIFSGTSSDDGYPMFWLEGGRMYVKNLGFQVEQVLITGVPTIASLDMDDEVPMSSEVANKLIEKVAEKVFGTPKEDKTNDSQ